ncbi:uncharacterized protein MYCFIDRAFT_169356 [Pseudocercospora fijiensis CIRAD86]|uniref:Uncharacterized protein n=1 Tax=Pseudocercospora fijiensis (strain CIRAD86) TaxID=383855 RepID=N1Q609_PSEFD|nr:uncharacterized protein MYCFIDRAFT_169356 [Pseudocercospora fijiensis CIRAD86]EME87544.1 hypothetical protein MYCFIDRAFT_169356 [Pseudocercospora fijiensis CIRAD86]
MSSMASNMARSNWRTLDARPTDRRQPLASPSPRGCTVVESEEDKQRILPQQSDRDEALTYENPALLAIERFCALEVKSWEGGRRGESYAVYRERPISLPI